MKAGNLIGVPIFVLSSVIFRETDMAFLALFLGQFLMFLYAISKLKIYVNGTDEPICMEIHTILAHYMSAFLYQILCLLLISFSIGIFTEFTFADLLRSPNGVILSSLAALISYMAIIHLSADVLNDPHIVGIPERRRP